MSKSIYEAIPRSRMNQHSPELQEELLKWRGKYCENGTHFIGGARVDLPVNGMLAMIARRTPFLIYDLPELKERVPTAFVDGVRCYFRTPSSGSWCWRNYRVVDPFRFSSGTKWSICVVRIPPG